MHKFKAFMKKMFTPVTIMLIPHSDSRSLRLKIPSVGIFASIILWCIGTAYVFSVAVDTVEYYEMKDKLNYYSGQFTELKTTISMLKKADQEFRRLFSLKNKQEILKNIDDSDSGSIDLENLKQQIKLTTETVGEIKDYLSQQRNLYISTPMGWPIQGRLTSQFGTREHPRSGEPAFHSGIDIAATPGSPIRATADGIVSFAGWSGGNGNLVVLEHGFGFSSFYGHNRSVTVSVGQRVKRGDLIGHIGSTGNSTGPHVHYEVWLNGKPQNPMKYLEGRS